MSSSSSTSYFPLVNVTTKVADLKSDESTAECLDGASVNTYYSLSDLDDEISMSLTTTEEEGSIFSGESSSESGEMDIFCQDGKALDGQLLLNAQNLQRILSCAAKFPNGKPRIQTNLVGLLKHREVIKFSYFFKLFSVLKLAKESEFERR